jgi:transposase
MPKHKSEDYKIVAVKHYLANKTGYTETCRIFKCSERSLKRWIEKYKKKASIKRYSRKPISYKITEKQVKYSLDALKKNEQVTMNELAKIVKKKYKNFDITPQHLGKIIRDNNKTRKRTTHEHFFIIRYNKIIDKKKELNKFYKKVSSYQLDKIISLDETSIQPSMLMEYSRCELGRRCIVKTSDSYLFRKFTLLVAINNSKCVGYILYKKGGMTKERLVEFMKRFIFGKYKRHLIILDNAGSHKNNFVKDAIIKSGNEFLFSVPYTPKTNPIENYFSQIKHYLKLNKKVLKFDELKKEIAVAIGKVRKENNTNYFLYAYKKKKLKLHNKRKSSLRRIPKNYKK